MTLRRTNDEPDEDDYGLTDDFDDDELGIDPEEEEEREEGDEPDDERDRR